MEEIVFISPTHRTTGKYIFTSVEVDNDTVISVEENSLRYENQYICATRVFAGTWNVGGRSPSSHLNLEDWLHTSPAADIYVIGYKPRLHTFSYTDIVCCTKRKHPKRIRKNDEM
jgi:hypothetical protein